MDDQTVANAKDLQPRIGETDKLTINLGVVDLGQIDLLVQEGFYSNRSDLIRTAIRNQLSSHRDAVRQTVDRRSLTIGLHDLTKDLLEEIRAEKRQLDVRVVGLARIASDVSAELARATIRSVLVLGRLQASPHVLKALAGRIA
jgi:Arc/MetJ-type ribon-helix-helix transcriptional regulator